MDCRMKKQTIAAALAVLAFCGSMTTGSARHLAEEYAERVHRERMGRDRQSAITAAEDRAERRRRWEEERRAEEEYRLAAEQDIPEEDEDSEYESFDEDTTVPDNGEGMIAGRTVPEGGETESLSGKNDMQEAEAPDPQRLEERDQEPSNQGPEDNTGNLTGTDAAPSSEKTETGEGLLARYLRLARERTGENGTERPTDTGVPLRVASEQTIALLKTETADIGGTLLFSDSPEYVKTPGILYTDIVKGDSRIFYYHVNETGKPCKVAVILETAEGQYSVVHITRRALAAPSVNYPEVGKSLQYSYFSDGQQTERLYIRPDERKLLLEDMDRTVLKPNELVAGMVDFSASAPVRVSVLLYPAGKDPMKYISEAEVLPADDHHLRGTFVGMDRMLRLERAYDPDDGAACIVLADGEYDRYREGVDATDGSLVTNYGNYGILYHLELPVRGKTRFLMSPRGGSYAGVVRVEEGKNGARLVAVPNWGLAFGSETVHASFTKDGRSVLQPTAEISDLGIFRKKPWFSFDFSPAGASNLPLMMILVPADVKLESVSPVAAGK